MPTAKIVKPQGEPDEFEQTISQVFCHFSCAVVEFDTASVSMLSNARPLYCQFFRRLVVHVEKNYSIFFVTGSFGARTELHGFEVKPPRVVHIRSEGIV